MVTTDAVGVSGSGVVVVESTADPPQAVTTKMRTVDRTNLAMTQLYATGAGALLGVGVDRLASQPMPQSVESEIRCQFL